MSYDRPGEPCGGRHGRPDVVVLLVHRRRTPGGRWTSETFRCGCPEFPWIASVPQRPARPAPGDDIGVLRGRAIDRLAAATGELLLAAPGGRLLGVRGLVSGDDVGRDAAAVGKFVTVLACPFTDGLRLLLAACVTGLGRGG